MKWTVAYTRPEGAKQHKTSSIGYKWKGPLRDEKNGHENDIYTPK